MTRKAESAQELLLARLRREFAAFRGREVRGTRVPDGLRNEVLSAVDGGVPTAAVCGACGVTRAQLDQWRARPGGRRAGARERAQVLEVVESEEAVGQQAEVALDVTVGSWRVSVRVRSGAGTGE